MTNCAIRRDRRAFTLIELVIVLAILAVVAGAAVPMASKFFSSKARAATRAELEQLSEAAQEYFRDTASLPTSVDELLTDPKVAGWAGPYVSVSTKDAWSGAADVQVDAWAHGYRFTTLGASLLELRSAGDDGEFGDATDILFTLDVTPVRRAQTLAQLETLNRAIGLYNSQYLPDDPLSTKYATLLSRLVSTGFLPASGPYSVDGWGNAFVADPAGKSPVVAVTSPNLGSTSSSGASSGGSGKGKGSGKSSGKGKGKSKG